MDPVIDLLKALVRIDSVNPSLVPGAAGETAVARALAEHMRAMGLEVHVQEVAEGRPNVVGVLEGREPGRSLMLCGHIDTVGVAGMTQPFNPVERDGRVYGRGSQDMKSGVAAMVDAARLIRDSGGLDEGRLIIACVVDEEHSSIGADALVTKWYADGAVVTEPTDLAIAIAHKGFEWVEVETEGRAAHGSRPREGRDAIRLMGRVLTELDALDHRLQSRPPHPLLGTASLHASLIHGGRELSSYPDRCQLQMERRTVPGEQPGSGAREVADILARLAAADAEFKAASRPLFARSPYEIAADHPLVATMKLVVAEQFRVHRSKFQAGAAMDSSASSAPSAAPSASAAPSVTGMSFWTDASVLGDAGIPSLLFGPTGAGLHGVEEWVEAGSVVTCRNALAELARRWCGQA
jgi:acetylornithine deacetylase